SPFGLGRVDWVNRFPMATVVAVEVWRWTPFMMLIILAGLQSQNPEVLEAARVDGANPLQAFRRITLPLVRPFIELGSLLGFVLACFGPVSWMWRAGLKPEPPAASAPPTIFFVPTLMEFQEVLGGDFPPFFINSAIASIVSTLLVLVLGLPAAYALAIRPVKRT